MIRNSICLDRKDIENYKSQCEIDREARKAAESSLQQYLDEGPHTDWYQEKPVIAVIALVAIIGIVNMAVKK